MMLFAAMPFICLLFVIVDLLPIYREKQRKLFWAYVAMLLLASTIALLISLGIKIPSVAGFVKNAVHAIWRLPPEE